MLTKEYLSDGKEVVITAKGGSMRPLLRDGVDRIILSNCTPKNLKVGDVVLYERSDSVFVIHRIVDNKDGVYDMLGDFQTNVERGVARDRILAVASGFIRGNKEFSAASKTYRFYVKLWSKTSFVRKTYIFCSNKLASLKRKINRKNGR